MTEESKRPEDEPQDRPEQAAEPTPPAADTGRAESGPGGAGNPPAPHPPAEDRPDPAPVAPDASDPAPATEADPADEPVEVAARPTDVEDDEAPTFDAPPPGSTGGPAPGVGASNPLGNFAWPMACHAITIVDLGISPLLIGVIGPLAIWLVLKDTDPEVDYHGKESLNFQLNVLFWYVALLIPAACVVGIPLLIALSILETVLAVIACVKTAQGERFRYPGIYRILQ